MTTTFTMPLDMFERKYVRFTGECSNHNGTPLTYTQVLNSIPISRHADKFNLSPCVNGLPSNFILKTKDWFGRINQTVPSYIITDKITFNTEGRAVPYNTFKIDVDKANAKADIKEQVASGEVKRDNGVVAIAAINSLPPNPTKEQVSEFRQRQKRNGVSDRALNLGITLAAYSLWDYMTTSPLEASLAAFNAVTSGGRTRRKRRF